ncbi:uncharacterized protein LOC113333221 [Papaver somniferum]|uniref:uncharacterized protein LOC113333221 n=1 Tax=Papaver somniferum TaxID=3469 RepID=UPI000E6F7699|nr:uncharacterized protein LOC113333221 [Papaver somniferum]
MQHFGNINKNIDYLQQDLSTIQTQAPESVDQDKVIFINKELNSWQKVQSEFYQQKSRDHFIKDMENNTKYFHIITNRKKKRNNIDSIQDHNNQWPHTREDIASHLTLHFKDISSYINPTLEEGFLQVLPSIISVEDNMLLTRTPSSQEVYNTLKSMENWSAPGPEGFQAGFYKCQWILVGDGFSSLQEIGASLISVEASG